MAGDIEKAVVMRRIVAAASLVALGATVLALAPRRAAQADPEQGACASRSRSPKPASIRRPSNDIYSNYVNRAMFDPLYSYDYLARPYKIVPNTAAALPEISPDGTTWTIKIKPGIYFIDDPAFKGRSAS